jgi:hypothetical protein
MRLNERLQTECAKHQKRFFHEDCDETETNYTLEGYITLHSAGKERPLT